jgi:hypothetical protein
MIPRFLRLAGVLPLLCSGLAMAAPDAQPSLLLVPGFYGLPAAGKTPGTPNAADLVRKPQIHRDFLNAIGYYQPGGSPLLSDLVSGFEHTFAENRISEVQPGNKYRSYAVSLEITRADQYRVNRPDGNVDIYLPVSVTLFFTNILSGEVLYSATMTDYRNLRETREAVDSGQATGRIHAAYRANLSDLIKGALARARDEFKPFRISAHVRDRSHGLYVLDRGLDAGIAVGSELLNPSGAGVRILYTGKNYAVGEPTLGDLKGSDELSMYATASAGDVVKPRAMILDADAPADLPGYYAALTFGENIGNRAAFTVIPENRDFLSVLGHVAGKKGLSQQEVTQNRVPPDYFVRIKVDEPQVTVLPTSHAFGKMRVLSGSAYAELLDRSGRVIHVSRAYAHLDDEVIQGGMSFDYVDRRKVLYANLFADLSQQFIREVHFKNDVLTLERVDQPQVTINDPDERLALGQSPRLFRPEGGSNANDSTLIPLWDLHVDGREGARVLASASLPVTSSPARIRSGDLVLLQSSSRAPAGKYRLTICASVRDIGGIPVRNGRSIAYFSMAAASTAPFAGGDITLSPGQRTLSVEQARLAHAGFRAPVQHAPVAATHCLQPLLKVDELARQCDAQSQTCEIDLKLIAGLQLYRQQGGEAQKLGAPQALSVTSHLESVPAGSADVYIQQHASRKIEEILTSITAKVDLSTAEK